MKEIYNRLLAWPTKYELTYNIHADLLVMFAVAIIDQFSVAPKAWWAFVVFFLLLRLSTLLLFRFIEIPNSSSFQKSLYCLAAYSPFLIGLALVVTTVKGFFLITLISATIIFTLSYYLWSYKERTTDDNS